VRAFLVEELKARKMPVNRDTMTSLANELRLENSPSYITDALYEQAKRMGKSAVIESIRTPGEVHALRAKGDFLLFAVDADAKKRYERIVVRKSETDAVSWDTFMNNEKREMNTSDPNKQNLQECIAMADYIFYNDHSIADLEEEVEKVLEKEGLA
jgi:dephospho-CoA kinase